MLARVRSAAVLGIDAYLVDVETDIASGWPTLVTVGLPQGAVKEGGDRVYSALANTGFTFPLKRITVNLAPRAQRQKWRRERSIRDQSLRDEGPGRSAARSAPEPGSGGRGFKSRRPD
jgi:Mg-chelatase subunit ChlI-like protein